MNDVSAPLALSHMPVALMANAIRALAMDAVQQANSGHPGMPMGMAEIAVALWGRHLSHNPANPHWANRDRFVLSNGHGSMLQYALLHLTGYDLPLQELRNFRQLHSRTPGHPERGETPGVETTTGPLGQGFAVAVGIIPYLVAMLVAVGVLRASGALDQALGAVRWAVAGIGVDGRWVDALPVALVRPLSGSGARGLVIETMKTFGADSFAGRLACVIQGSTETTFYVLAVYFGSVGIKRPRHAIACGLTAELAGFLGAVAVSYLFWG